jgi:ribosomal protein L29
MKRNDIKALADKTVAELNAKLIEQTSLLAKARLEKKAGKLSNPRSVSVLADDIARIKTMLRVKEMSN